FCYTLRAANGATSRECLPSRLFSYSDYVFLFGSLGLSGSTFLLTGLFVFLIRPRDPASRALLAAGTGIGIFALTALDLYGPHWFFRLHIIGETLVAPGFFYLAAVFPTDRLQRRRRRAVALIYAPFVLLIVFYQYTLSSPTLYTWAHLTATVGQ